MPRIAAGIATSLESRRAQKQLLETCENCVDCGPATVCGMLDTQTQPLWNYIEEDEEAEVAADDLDEAMASSPNHTVSSTMLAERQQGYIDKRATHHRQQDPLIRVRVQIIRNARTHSVGKYHSCMFSNVGLIVHAPVQSLIDRANATHQGLAKGLIL